ncbi:porphobilinogen deaminase [Tieghemiomyces parasiticus]|uniref:hydroxymethylbilane synthase n=1 Tax=Tieghemiomyces parasiticus TaxID=78921 RepID=A0A9W7ZVW2_9FUNG|nr:porphobilinogen deaminase [Tieghemiomyces parasiticus]
MTIQSVDPLSRTEVATGVPIGTRKSALALIQTHHVRDLLQRAHPDLQFPLLAMSTQGDKIQDVALSKIGEKALFTKELEVALEDGRVDLVVHSLKDLPTTLPAGMGICAMLEREDPRDAVVLNPRHASLGTLDRLPPGSVVGTSSVRRIAQLRRQFPHLTFADVRGNLNTRLRKLDDPQGTYDALILAVAGMRRMGWADRISQILPESTILHAVGQGALAVECRLEDTRIFQLVKPLVHQDTQLRCTAERAVMRELEGGCSVPLGVYTELSDPTPGARSLRLRACVVSLDGQEYIETEHTIVLEGTDDLEAAERLGRLVADKMRRRGASELLASIRSP